MDDAMWAALADPRRRAVVDALRDGERDVTELGERLGFSQPMTSKHLRVLREAGLVHVRAEAQRRVYRLDLMRMAELDAWLAPYRQKWTESLRALGKHLDAAPPPRPTPTPTPTPTARRTPRRARKENPR